MLIDASVIASILLSHQNAPQFVARIEAAKSRVYTTPIARIEAIALIAKAKSPSAEIAPELFDAVTNAVDQLLTEIPAQQVTISPDIGQRAIEAFAHYGQHSGHPAALSLGDCISQAAAKTYRLPLLRAGEDL